ncbi:amidohydrolase family protein [Thiolinea disciformis]|uniref:amidohydrolase family protein n=1 Tax=Thiolinea disciformis TaxID=125614 RepID=UPI00036C0C7E|nr:amidohydrolase family protein [Thiolinea disciformis]
MHSTPPKTPRIDAHQHFWRIARGDYSWLTPSLGVLYQDFLPDQLKPLLDQQGIEGTVLVQAADTLAETHYMLGFAEQYDWILGIVGWVDMDQAEAVEQIELLTQHPKLVGIRPMIQDIPDPDWMLAPHLAPAFQALIDHDLCFDALVHPKHLANLLTLLKRYPKLKCVIDHGAKPAIHVQQFEDWAAAMRHLASETQTYCKLSGLVTEAGQDWNQEQLKPYVDFLLETFGAERLMFGSDWPVLKLASDYAEWVQTVEAFTNTLSASEQASVWGGSAKGFYGL